MKSFSEFLDEVKGLGRLLSPSRSYEHTPKEAQTAHNFLTKQGYSITHSEKKNSPSGSANTVNHYKRERDGHTVSVEAKGRFIPK